MIPTLFKYRFIMAKNRFANMAAAEKSAYAAAVLFVAGFIFFMVLIGLKKADMIVEIINPAAFQYFNYLSAAVLNVILLTAVSVEVFAEIEDIYYRRETQFVLQFPNDFSKYFIYKLIEISLKFIPVLILLTPLGMLYAFFFLKYYGAAVFMNFAIFFTFSLAVVLLFSSALVMGLTAVTARLLSFFKQRTLFLIAALVITILFCFYFPAVKEALSQKNQNKVSLASIYSAIKGAAGKFDILPAAILAEGANDFVKDNYSGLAANIFYSLAVTVASFFISYFINLILFYRDIGSLLDKMSLRQNSAGSIASFPFSGTLPALWRGAVYDEICHIMRKNVLLVFAVMLPAIFALPFYLPPKLFEAVRTSNKYWIMFAINSIIIMYGSEFMAGDLISKRSFMQLLRPMSVNLKDFLTAKIAFYWLIWTSLLLFTNSSWMYFMRLDIAEFIEMFILMIIWSAAASYLFYGAASISYAMILSKKDQDGLQPADPLIQIITFIVLGVMCVGSIKLYNSGIEMAFIFAYFLLWLAVSFIIFSAGVKALEKKEL